MDSENEYRSLLKLREIVMNVGVGFMIGSVICAAAAGQRAQAAEVPYEVIHLDTEPPTEKDEPADVILPITSETNAVVLEEMVTDSEFMEDMDAFHYRDFIPLSEDLQRLLWDECEKYGIDFLFAAAVIKQESDFRASATNHNSNGSVDRGLFQTNSCWIKDLKRIGYISSANDLYDARTGIKCGTWELAKCVQHHGNSESAYYEYNTGKSKGGSNRNSRKVMSYMAEYKALLS